jgi:hypothetical protein
MGNQNDRGAERAENARAHDDSELIDRMEDAPSHGNRSGGRTAHDVATQDELKQAVDGGGVTRVRAGDKPEEADLPRYNEDNRKLNP